MTPGQFIDLLAEAGMLIEESPGVFGWKPTIEKAEKFAELVAASERDRIADEAKHIIKRAEQRGAETEREACAKVCEEIKGVKLQGYEFAAVIRARGKE